MGANVNVGKSYINTRRGKDSRSMPSFPQLTVMAAVSAETQLSSLFLKLKCPVTF